MASVKILALEPYYGGSHKAFLDGWIAGSRHSWTVLSLPAYKWKWRMRQAAIEFSQRLRQLPDDSQKWDLIFCSDMLNLAEFLGLAPGYIRQLKTILYFHENQITYPVQVESERDYQFAMTNITSALAAGRVWFNSGFHKKNFLEAAEKFLKKMPDNQPLKAIGQIENKSDVYYPGVKSIKKTDNRKPGPLRILWSARWEHDKSPEEFFEALKILRKKGADFRISVTGESFRDVPEVFAQAREYFADHIDVWGYQENTEDYHKTLTDADVFVSTAAHEFFGIGTIEAVGAGAYPLLPLRLSYPELLMLEQYPDRRRFFYNDRQELAEKLYSLSKHSAIETLLRPAADELAETLGRFGNETTSAAMDDAVEKFYAGP